VTLGAADAAAAVGGAAATGSASTDVRELREGAWVTIGDCLCQVRFILGTGSFGAVWAADAAAEDASLAIKEILCSTQADLLNALFEGHLLRLFGGAGATAAALGDAAAVQRGEAATSTEGDERSALARAIPALVACDTQQLEGDVWRVRLAMTRVSGEPLDAFLRRRAQRLGAWGGRAAGLRQRLLEGSHFARQLLTQLAPAFEHISAYALHRDVNAHNILVDGDDEPLPRYGLVDFGLAVDAQCWQSGPAAASTTARPSRVGQDGACTWHHLDVGGDCRYWPVSAWVQFLLGWTELEACPPLCFEYKTQIDLHSLGLTALQVIAEMLPMPPDPLDPSMLQGSAIREICTLRLAWENYWLTVSPLHTRLIDTFHNGGSWDALKTDCLEDGIHEVVAQRLTDLRFSLFELCDACRQAPEEAGIGNMADLFSTLLLLISNGDSNDRVEGPTRWREVSLALGGQTNTSSSRCDPADERRLSPAASAPTSAWSSGALQSATDASTASTASSMGCCRGACSVPPHENSLAHSVSSSLIAGHAQRSLLAGTTVSSCSPGTTLDSSAELLLRATELQATASKAPPPVVGGGDTPAADPPNSRKGEDLMLRLNDLKAKVEWLRHEMAKLGDTRDGSNCRDPREAMDDPDRGQAVSP